MNYESHSNTLLIKPEVFPSEMFKTDQVFCNYIKAKVVNKRVNMSAAICFCFRYRYKFQTNLENLLIRLFRESHI